MAFFSLYIYFSLVSSSPALLLCYDDYDDDDDDDDTEELNTLNKK
jgi:hypothetical protein